MEVREASIVLHGNPARKCYILEVSRKYPDEVLLYPVKKSSAYHLKQYVPFWVKIDELMEVKS